MPIHPDSPASRPSTLPLPDIQHMLAAAGHPVSLSDDPGRYLCNQIFYIARHHIETHSLPCPAGFIHLPLESDYPTAWAVDALALVAEMLSKVAKVAVGVPPQAVVGASRSNLPSGKCPSPCYSRRSFQ